MKNPRLPRPDRLLLLLAVVTALPLGAALQPADWRHRQALEVTQAGLVKVPLPPATFDAVQPGLADLRILDASDRELASLLDREVNRAPAPPARLPAARAFTVTPAKDGAVLLIDPGIAGPLRAVDLETSAPYFLKAAHVDISTDGQEWQSVGPAVPIFRQFGAELLRLPLGDRPATFVRVTFEDFRARPVTFTGARVQATPGPVASPPPASTPVAAAITRREEFAGESVLTVTLPARHLPLQALSFEVPEALFMRRVVVAVRDVQGAVSSERTVAAGTLYRISLDGAPPRAQLDLPVDFPAAARELIVHVVNGDSPPLAITGVHALLSPLHLIFNAPAPGTYTLLAGNPRATAARYDLAAFSSELRTAASTTVMPGPLTDNPGYDPRNAEAEPALAGVTWTGVPLDSSGWTERRGIRLERPGVQELELDPAALAGARPDLIDLRVLHAGNQIPYVLESPALLRSLTLTAEPMADPKRPGVSRWRIQLPRAGLPLRRLVLASPTTLFARQVRVYEQVTTREGGTLENMVASGAWSRTPESDAATRTFELPDRLRTDALWIETDNGDNPPIVLGSVQATYPVVRLVFQAGATADYLLLYGNAAAGAARYDLSLVAAQLLTAPRVAATLDPAPAAAVSDRFGGRSRTVLFWSALGLVVVVLLVVVAKLLPAAATKQ
jgi:hypothetical protein